MAEEQALPKANLIVRSWPKAEVTSDTSCPIKWRPIHMIAHRYQPRRSWHACSRHQAVKYQWCDNRTPAVTCRSSFHHLMERIFALVNPTLTAPGVWSRLGVSPAN